MGVPADVRIGDVERDVLIIFRWLIYDFGPWFVSNAINRPKHRSYGFQKQRARVFGDWFPLPPQKEAAHTQTPVTACNMP